MRQLMENKKSNDQASLIAGGDSNTATTAATNINNASSQDGTNHILRRNHRGCKLNDFYNWPDQPFDEMDSPLAVQQYIQQLIFKNPADIDEILRLPEGQDLGAWKIEHLRLVCMQLNRLAAKLQDCCHPETCNQMTATEQWIFLCAAHKQPNECPAIDYTRHTLDGAASLLNSNKYFPSRVTIKDSSVAKLSSVCRRLYRVFSHAYYHHFQIFDEFEEETHLCKRFSQFVTMYELMPKESLIVPADGSKPNELASASSEGVEISSLETSKNDKDNASEGSKESSSNQGASSINSPAEPSGETDDKQSTTGTTAQDLEPKIKLEPSETSETTTTSNNTPSNQLPQATTSTTTTTTTTAATPPKAEGTRPKIETSATNVVTQQAKQSLGAVATASPSQPKSGSWSPSIVSTNTMVKNSPNTKSPASSTGQPAKKPELETKSVKSALANSPAGKSSA